MLQANPFATVPQGVSWNAADAGAAGASGGSGAPGAGSSGAAGSGVPSGGGAGAAGSSAPVSLSDDTSFSYGGKTYTPKEFFANHVPKSELDSARTATTESIKQVLQQLARAGQGAQNVSKQNPPADPFAGVRDMPFVDGKTLEAMAKTQLAPIAHAINAMQQRMLAQEKTIQGLRGGVAPIAAKHSDQEFQQRIGTAIATLPGVDAKDPFVSELAQDVFHSYEWAKGKEDQEYQKYLADRYTAAEKHFKEKFAKQLADAKTRKWQRPGGNATPSGAAVNPLARATPRDIARNVFAGQQTGT